MRLFTCTDHDGHWPVGAASVVVASGEAEASALLDEALKKHGLKPYADCRYTLREINITTPRAFILQDGDY